MTPEPGHAEEATQLVHHFDAVLLDLDGVVLHGRAPVRFAVEALAAAQDHLPLRFVTNNATRSSAAVADHLSALGVPTESRQIITSAEAAAHVVAQECPGARVLSIGSAALSDALRAAGLTIVSSADDRPDYVVQGMDRSLGWRDLAEAVRAVMTGARHVATNLDPTVPTDKGLLPANGAMVAAVSHASGVEPLSVGKPSPWMFRHAARTAGAHRPLVVGDSLRTDIAGARAAGFAGLHVLTGVDSAADVLRAAAHARPDYLGADVQALWQPHPLPQQSPDGSWLCRGAVARCQGSTVRVQRGSSAVDITEVGRISLDELRAAAAAAWHESDRCGRPTVLSPAGGHLCVEAV